MQGPSTLLLAVQLLAAALQCGAFSVARAPHEALQLLASSVSEALFANEAEEVTAVTYTKKSKRDCVGATIKTVQGDVAKCKTKCTAEPACLGFTYSPQSSPTWCNLKSSVSNIGFNDKRHLFLKDPTPAPTASPAATPAPGGTPAPPAATAAPAASPTAAPAGGGTAAVGDPHLVNVHGQRFDIYQPGLHALLQIPGEVQPQGTLLRVEALAEQVGEECGGIYFTAFNITGHWVNEIGGVHFYAGSHPEPGGFWQTFGKLSIKVAAGHTAEGIQYLNIYTRSLSNVGYTIGGLLGEDDHTDVSSMSNNCKNMRRMSLAQLRD